MEKIKFDQHLQGELSTNIIVETVEQILKDKPEIDRAKLIVEATKKLRGKTNSAQIAKIVKIKGYFK